MMQLVAASNGECSWACICAPNDARLIVDIIVPKQENTRVSTIFDTKDVMALCESAGYTMERLVLWGHSHDVMDCFFSGTDIATAKKLEWDVQYSLVLNKKVAAKYFSGKPILKADYYLRLDIFYMGLDFTVGEKLEFTVDMDVSSELSWAQITLEEQASYGTAPVTVYKQSNHGTPGPRPTHATTRRLGLGLDDDDGDGHYWPASMGGLVAGHQSRHGGRSGPSQRHLPADLAVLLSWSANARSKSAMGLRGALPYMAHVLYYEGFLKPADLEGLEKAVTETHLVPNDVDEWHLLDAFCKQAKERGSVVSWSQTATEFEIVVASEYKRVQCTYDDASGWWMAGASVQGRRVLHDEQKTMDGTAANASGGFWKAKPIATMWERRPPDYMVTGCLSKNLRIRAGQVTISIWMGVGGKVLMDTCQDDEYGLVAVVPDSLETAGWAAEAPTSPRAEVATQPPTPEPEPPLELQEVVDAETGEVTAAAVKKSAKKKTTKKAAPKEATA